MRIYDQLIVLFLILIKKATVDLMCGERASEMNNES